MCLSMSDLCCGYDYTLETAAYDQKCFIILQASLTHGVFRSLLNICDRYNNTIKEFQIAQD